MDGQEIFTDSVQPVDIERIQAEMVMAGLRVSVEAQQAGRTQAVGMFLEWFKDKAYLLRGL